ncbi:FosX/FosE/FosI family fosfomycin resistance thiol transferase [Rhodanobacter glycinis]|uniref:VOC family protein n=1 Tax=Rhodanobacter glycinis TaxID=582702 RepID=UPI00112AB0A5|nr:VOC family protein [Rhodanobacter glycinis]TPG51039.1 FosX/FosE/FosI family fosfomycin resistance thiol transferase [Rhodanobacter glycinis]
MEGISHITFIVKDLERMATFLCQGLGAREIYDSAGQNHSLSREKFFLLGGVWIAAMEGEPLAQRSYQHIAFSVGEADRVLPRFRGLLSQGLEGPTPNLDSALYAGLGGRSM